LACDVGSVPAHVINPMAWYLRFFVFTLPSVVKGGVGVKIMREKKKGVEKEEWGISSLQVREGIKWWWLIWKRKRW